MKKEPCIIADGDTINGQSLIVVKGTGKLEKLNELQVYDPLKGAFEKSRD